MQNEKSAPAAVDYYCKWSRFFIALCVLRRYARFLFVVFFAEVNNLTRNDIA